MTAARVQVVPARRGGWDGVGVQVGLGRAVRPLAGLVEGGQRVKDCGIQIVQTP
jgi:hypothetical protein